MARMVWVRQWQPGDEDAIWRILKPVIRGGETYALPRDMARGEALGYWTAPDRRCFVAGEGDSVLGTYTLRANQPGGGAHVANCGYMTAAGATGRGVARAMCEHSLATARAAGFRAMQFNFVIASNQRAVRLWHAMGFETVGRLPGAFLHPALGYTDALVMHRLL